MSRHSHIINTIIHTRSLHENYIKRINMFRTWYSTKNTADHCRDPFHAPMPWSRDLGYSYPRPNPNQRYQNNLWPVNANFNTNFNQFMNGGSLTTGFMSYWGRPTSGPGLQWNQASSFYQPSQRVSRFFPDGSGGVFGGGLNPNAPAFFPRG